MGDYNLFLSLALKNQQYFHEKKKMYLKVYIIFNGSQSDVIKTSNK